MTVGYVRHKHAIPNNLTMGKIELLFLDTIGPSQFRKNSVLEIKQCVCGRLGKIV